VLELDVALIDRSVRMDDHLGSRAVALDERDDRSTEHVIGTVAHVDEHLSKLTEGSVEFLTHAAVLLLVECRYRKAA
jgi:hypothetical protein